MPEIPAEQRVTCENMENICKTRIMEGLLIETRGSSKTIPKIGFPGGLVVKNPPANAGASGDTVQSLSQEDPLEREMATHSNILSWEIPWQRGLVGCSP